MPGGYGVTISALTSPAHSESGLATAAANVASRGESTWRVNGGVWASRPEQAAEPPPPACSPYRAARSRNALTSSSRSSRLSPKVTLSTMLSGSAASTAMR